MRSSRSDSRRALWPGSPPVSRPGHARAQGQLVLYCTPQEEWCRAMVTAFERATGIKVSMTRKSSGENYAQVKAEAAEPEGRHLVGRHRGPASAGCGGRAHPRVQVAEAGRAPGVGGAPGRAVEVPARSGVYAGALGFGFNTELLAKKGLPEPKCWADLLDPKFKDEVQVADPNSSGTSYTMLATMVQIMGEDKGFDYLKKLHKNVNQYTKSGAAPAQAMSQGETLIGITFMHDIVTWAVQGRPVKVVAPCEGTGYEIGSMSIIKGAPNLGERQEVVRLGAHA